MNLQRSGIIAVIIVAAAIILNPFYIIGPGQVGVTFNRITGDMSSHSMGMGILLPMVQTMNKFDVKTQRVDLLAESASKDLQDVKIDVVLNYHLQYDKVNDLYMKVGRDYTEKVIDPAINEAVKASAAQYPVEDIIVHREELKNSIEKLLTTRLASYNIVLESINLLQIQFTPEFNKAVEEKQIAEQKIKTAEYEKEQAAQTKQKTILEAEGEARKQELLKQTVSEKGIALQWIAKWNGVLPNVMAGDKGNMMMFNLGDIEKNK
jgi:regulator of protease activity HflC (stomatin/prohibitin superfamily)